MKVYAVNIFAQWELYDYELFDKLEDAELFVTAHNSTLDSSCRKEHLCCFARLEEKEVK